MINLPLLKSDVDIGDCVLSVEISGGREIYRADSEFIYEFNGINEGLEVTREFSCCGKEVKVIFSFDPKNLISQLIVDGQIIKDPLFEEFSLIQEHGYESRSWRTLKKCALIIGIVVIGYLIY